jgi:hypothetical protein
MKRDVSSSKDSFVFRRTVIDWVTNTVPKAMVRLC